MTMRPRQLERRTTRRVVPWAAALGLALVAARAAGASPSEGERVPPVTIELRPEAVISTAQVRLGDVAALTTLDRGVLERLMALPLGPAPRSGTLVRLKREPLLRWIRARTGLRAADIAWGGAAEAVVRAAVETLPGQQIAERARQALSDAVAESGLRVGALSPAVPGDMEVPRGPVALQVRPVPRAAVLSRRPTVWVDVHVEGRFVRTVPITFEVSVFGPGYVAVAKRSRGDAIDAEAVEVREVKWSGSDVLPVEQGAPLRFRRPVEAGTVLTRSHVEPAPALKRGSWATLRAGTGLVTLERRVEVLEDGEPGQVVRVRPAGAQESLLARVTGADALEVER